MSDDRPHQKFTPKTMRETRKAYAEGWRRTLTFMAHVEGIPAFSEDGFEGLNEAEDRIGLARLERHKREAEEGKKKHGDVCWKR